MHLAVDNSKGRRRQVPKLDFEKLEDFIMQAKERQPATWLINELVPAQGTLLLQGMPGGGKTWLCLIIAKEASKQKRPVFLIEEESSTYAFGKRLEQMAFPADAEVFILHRKSFRVDVREQLQALIATLMPMTEPPVVILDPLVHLWVGDENKTSDVSMLVQHLAMLRGFEDALICVPTHVSKGSQNGDKPTVYGARGSSVLAGWFDCILNVEFCEREPGTEAMLITPVKSRDLEMYNRRKLVLTKGTGESSIKSDKQDRHDKLAGQVLDFVKSRGAPVSKREIARAMGANMSWVLKTVDGLLADGTLRRSSVSRGGGALIEAAESVSLLPYRKREAETLGERSGNTTETVGNGHPEEDS